MRLVTFDREDGFGDTVAVIFRFEEAELDTAAFELRIKGSPVPLEPQAFEVLSYLVKHRDRMVPRSELLDVVWGDRFVSDGALANRIAASRAAIGDDGRAQRLIRTVHGRGLQFIGDVVVDTSAAGFANPADPDGDRDGGSGDGLTQTVRFASAPDGHELAVATVGDGQPLVKVANWLTHVDKDWDSPIWRHWNSELGRRFRYVRYDARGCGLSNHVLDHSRLTDLDLWVDDLEAVIDGAGLDQFVLFAMSQGCGPAMAYAASRPNRVSHLVLLGGYSRGMKRRDDAAAAEADINVEMIRTGWGGRNPAFRSFFTTTLIPNATTEHVRWFNDLQAETTTTENAMLLERAFHEQDYSELAKRISVPTLVVHAEDDMAVPYDEGRRLASLIPDAEFVTLASANHVLLSDEPAWPDFLHHLDRFTSAH